MLKYAKEQYESCPREVYHYLSKKHLVWT